MSIKKENVVVPINDFTKKFFPNLYTAIINSGMLNASIVVPIGMCKK